MCMAAKALPTRWTVTFMARMATEVLERRRLVHMTPGGMRQQLKLKGTVVTWMKQAFTSSRLGLHQHRAVELLAAAACLAGECCTWLSDLWRQLPGTQ